MSEQPAQYSTSNIATTPCVLTIAGSDSGAGAGIQADLKTFAASGIYGTSVITAITAQNTEAVIQSYPLPVEQVQAQLQAVLADIHIDAIKTGMLPNVEIIDMLADTLATSPIPLVIDPVLQASSGATLADDDCLNAIRKKLLPRATLLTPNLEEAAALLHCEAANSIEQMEQQAKRLLMLGCKAVLLKGGHLPHKQSADVFASTELVKRFSFEKVDTQNTHGTGCTLAAAIAAGLAKGHDLPKAIAEARHYLHSALVYGRNLHIGHGHGPLQHFWQWQNPH